MKKPITLKIDKYICETLSKQKKLLDILEEKRRILLVANPGTGKTKFASELMKKQKKEGFRFVYATFLTAIPKQLQSDFNFELVCSSYDSIWTARIDSMRPGDDYLEDDELVIGTTLHQLARFADSLTDDDVIVIDEGHQLVQLSHQSQIQALRDELKVTKAKLLLMTGTPFDEEDKRLNLSIVKVIESKPRVDKLIYVPITKNIKDKTNILDLTATLIHWHLSQDDNSDTKKMLVYNNSSKIENEALVETILSLTGYPFDNINADLKDTPSYKYLISDHKIRDDVNGIVTTSVIKEGINIKNQDIDVIIVLGNLTQKEEKQIVKRIRGDKPIEIYRIYDEPDNDSISDVEFEIYLVKLLVQSFKNQPKKLKNTLQRLANCGEILKSTGILDKNVESINEVKAQDIIEQLTAQKCTLEDYLERQDYNDLEAIDGYPYLDENYDLFIADIDKLGDFSTRLELEKEDARDNKDQELKDTLHILFGNSSTFELTMDALKKDLLSYSREGRLLRDIDEDIISDISDENYINPNITDDPFEDMDDNEKEDAINSAVKLFSTKHGSEIGWVIKILYYLSLHTSDYKKVLPILNESIMFQDLNLHAKRFELSNKLYWIKLKLNRSARRGSRKERVRITETDDLIRLSIIREIESHLRKYKVVYVPLLSRFMKSKYSADQYRESLNLNSLRELKMYVFAMGVTEYRSSWKRSTKNSRNFDRLWKDAGKKGKPQNRDSFRVFGCKLCTPEKLIDHFYELI